MVGCVWGQQNVIWPMHATVLKTSHIYRGDSIDEGNIMCYGSCTHQFFHHFFMVYLLRSFVGFNYSGYHPHGAPQILNANTSMSGLLTHECHRGYLLTTTQGIFYVYIPYAFLVRAAPEPAALLMEILY